MSTRTDAVRSLTRLVARHAAGPTVPIATQRARTDVLARAGRLPRGTAVSTDVLGGVPAERLRPPGAAEDGAVLHLHGGGHCIGSARSHRALAAGIAARAGVVAYVTEHRLAPEHPAPAALDDARAAYEALLERGIEPARIVVTGDSAGGGLALALTVALRDAGRPLPAALGLLCPWLDLVPDAGASRPDVPRDPLLRAATLTVWARAYARDLDAGDPRVSPLRADLRGLPPIVLHSAQDDPLAPDALALAARADRVTHEHLDGLWHVPHALADLLPDARAALDRFGAALRDALAPSPGPSVAIIGAGISGLAMAEALRREGIHDVTVLEKADEVGGTWRENRYPGLSCDVPSRFYAFSFAPNPGWSRAFSPGREIQDYVVRTATERGLRDLVRFGAHVEEARWTDDGRWRLTLRDGATLDADVVVSATGVLHHPKLPDIAGQDDFAGRLFHSAQWPDDVDLTGRRVAVIGTGSTGVQITCATAGVASRLLLFQRTAQWVIPIADRAYSPVLQRLLRRVPALNTLAYRTYQRALEGVLGPAVTRPGWQRRALGTACRLNLRFGVKDPELRRRLTPPDEPMCKRLVMSSRFYPTVQRDDVELVTDAIDRIVPTGIRTRDGTVHEVDVIVLATGFDPHAYLRPMRVTGPGGLTLDDVWAQGPRAYRTVALPGLPNLFTVMGPHSPVGNHSLIAVAESQSRFIAGWAARIRRERLATVTASPAATDAYYEELRAALPGTVWVTGCRSWYLDEEGLPELWPWTPARHREMLEAPVEDDWLTTTRAGAFVA